MSLGRENIPLTGGISDTDHSLPTLFFDLFFLGTWHAISYLEVCRPFLTLLKVLTLLPQFQLSSAPVKKQIFPYQNVFVEDNRNWQTNAIREMLPCTLPDVNWKPFGR